MTARPAPVEADLDDEEFAIEFEEVTPENMTDEDRRLMAEIDAGKFISHEAVKRWVLSLHTDNPLPRPECGD